MTLQLTSWNVWQLFASIIFIKTDWAVCNNGGKLKYLVGGTVPEKEAIKVSLFP
jgi:hypothetical protein